MLRIFGISLFVLASISARAECIDTVRFREGKPVEGEIVKLSWNEIVVSVAGARVIYPGDRNLAGIDWDDDSVPAGMANGRRQFAANDFAAAAASFAKGAGAQAVRAVIRQECLFRSAECQRLAANYVEAAKEYRALLTGTPDTFYLREASAGLVDSLLMQSPPACDEAHKAIEEMLAKTKESSPGPEFVGDLKLRDARVYEMQNQLSKAQGIYAGLTADRTPRIQWAACAGLGSCQLGFKEFEKAKSTFQRIVDNADRLQAASLRRAWNGLGECHLAAAPRSEGDFKDALMCFLRTVALYVPDSGEPADDHAKAILFAARCYHSLATLAQDPKQQSRFTLEFQKLKDRFRDSYGGGDPAWEKKIEEPL